jgi:predicted transcriptional regulator
MRSNPTRDAILNLLEDSPDPPGTTADEVRGGLQADAPLSAVVYHLRVLADNGRLECDDSQAAPRFLLASA